MSSVAARPSSLPPDPRPALVPDGRGAWLLAGARCVACGHAIAHALPRCPRCRAETAPARFGPDGTVWASTVVHVPARPGEDVPFALAYVDLDDGPRVLVRVAGDPGRVAVGGRVRLREPTDAGDPAVEVVA